MASRKFDAAMIRMTMMEDLKSDIPQSAFLQVLLLLERMWLHFIQAAAHIRCAVKGRKPQYLFTERGIRLRWYFQR